MAIRRLAVILGLVALNVVAGCGFIRQTETERKGFGDRCADIVKESMPGIELDIVKATAASPEITRLVARVDAARKDRPEGAPDRELTAECQFDNGTLTGFRWTKGGPTPR
jgi:hypothetical protein